LVAIGDFDLLEKQAKLPFEDRDLTKGRDEAEGVVHFLSATESRRSTV